MKSLMVGIPALVVVLHLTANAAWGQERSEMRLVLEIGQVDGPLHYALDRPAYPRPIPRERLLVVDVAAGTIHVYTMAGSHLYSFGRRGAGPGEFSRPGEPIVLSDQIQIVDGDHRRLSTFTLEGQLIEDWRAPDQLGGVGSPTTRLANGRWFAHQLGSVSSTNIAAVVRGSERAGGSGLGYFLTAQGADVDTLMTYELGAPIWYEADRGLPFGGIPVNLGASALVAMAGDSLIVTIDNRGGDITWYRAEEPGLTQIARVSLGLRRTPVTTADLARLEREYRATGSRVPERIAFIAPDYHGHFSRALLDEEGNVWLQRLASSPAPDDESNPPAFLVVSQDASTRDVRLPEGFVLSAVQGRLLFGTARGLFDVPLVRVYEMR